MKKKCVAVAVAFLVACAASDLHAADSAAPQNPVKQPLEIGRYQLFQGTFTTLDLKYSQASSTHNAVFLLDTATGQVKRYSNRIDEDGRYIETWLPTDVTQQMGIKKTVSPQLEGK
jgi:hypothetical protein